MLTVFAAFLVLHFLAYAVYLRDSALLRTERGIFLYHLAAAAITACAGVVYVIVANTPPGLGVLVLALSAQGIYSISFLEFWSLAQGGYSLSVLRSLAGQGAEGTEARFAHLEQIGATKQRERIAGLAALGLIAEADGEIALTTCGGVVARILECVLKWIDPTHEAGATA